ncbi:hypothetical protein YDYSY3_57450 [Paenibacillus chitinolyticus]|uniref:hypothetical protein n=1 Tax=Paenibacillus chitinolyticus TaxID=79263 RepID=UPI0026E49A63|nr:hypothetical protein [Paenibacillus chitinolyticus]GKS14745.1 hypothetical protein YDYSY3_57450 [Paenibacillus chitinolyticus]
MARLTAPATAGQVKLFLIEVNGQFGEDVPSETNPHCSKLKAWEILYLAVEQMEEKERVHAELLKVINEEFGQYDVEAI